MTMTQIRKTDFAPKFDVVRGYWAEGGAEGATDAIAKVKRTIVPRDRPIYAFYFDEGVEGGQEGEAESYFVGSPEPRSAANKGSSELQVIGGLCVVQTLPNALRRSADLITERVVAGSEALAEFASDESLVRDLQRPEIEVYGINNSQLGYTGSDPYVIPHIRLYYPIEEIPS